MELSWAEQIMLAFSAGQGLGVITTSIELVDRQYIYIRASTGTGNASSNAVTAPAAHLASELPGYYAQRTQVGPISYVELGVV